MGMINPEVIVRSTSLLHQLNPVLSGATRLNDTSKQGLESWTQVRYGVLARKAL
jgi:hypothetical protein